MASFASSTNGSCEKEVIGIDIGSSKTMVVLSNGDIIRNELGGISIATLVAFHTRERLIGEAGVQQASANPQTAVSKINRLLGATNESFANDTLHQVARFPVMYDDQQKLCVSMECHGQSTQFYPESLLAMLLVKIGKLVENKVGKEGKDLQFVCGIPVDYTQQQQQALLDAMAIAGYTDIALHSVPSCLGASLATKYPAADETPLAALIDMGQTQTSISVVKMEQGTATILSTASDYNLGCLDFDVKLFEFFLGKYNLESAGVSLSKKSGSRLLVACEKLRKLLSTLPSAQIMVEMLVDDRDINLDISRDELATCCAPLIETLKKLASDALTGAGDITEGNPISSIELMGGGSRMPLVQNVLKEVFGDVLIGQKLDDASAAFGAALLQNKLTGSAEPEIDKPANEETEKTEAKDSDSPSSMEVDDESHKEEEKSSSIEVEEPQNSEEVNTCPESNGIEEKQGMSQEEINDLISQEKAMQQKDSEAREIASWKNTIEAFVFETRNAFNGKHGELLNREALEPFLVECEDWFYSEEAETASLDLVKQKHDAIRDKIREIGAAYYAKLEEEQKKMEAELEEESKKAEAEKAANPEEDDHDFRKLKKPERMRMVMKNKDEGNELFKDGNWRPAAARYVKALGHCSKFYDLSPEDEAEVRQVKISLYMNIAKCYLKMDNLDKMLQNCNDAISYDSENPKALYLRAFAYEKKRKFEEAQDDLKKALEKSPDDKASQKLMERVKIQIKRQTQKEKKMWSKAFS